MKDAIVNIDFVSTLYRDELNRSIKQYLNVDVEQVLVLCKNKYLSGITKGNYHILSKVNLQWPSDSEESRFILAKTNCGIPFISFYDSERTYVVKKTDYMKFCRFARNISRENLKKKVFQKPILSPEIERIIKEEIFDFFIHGAMAEKCGVKLTKSIVLQGSAGNGKTSVLKWIETIANQKKLSYAIVSSAKIQGAMGKDGLAELFHSANIICFDDVDIEYFSSNRKNGVTCPVLSAMDGPGIKVTKPIFRIFTTNEELKDIDPAFRRPGRIDKFLTIELPTPEMRLQFVNIWDNYIIRHLTNEDKKYIVDNTEKQSFAWMESIKSELFKQICNCGKIDVKRAVEDGRQVETALKKRAGFGL